MISGLQGTGTEGFRYLRSTRRPAVSQSSAELTNGPKVRDFGPYRSTFLKWSNTAKGFRHLKYESTVVISTDDKHQMEAS